MDRTHPSAVTSLYQRYCAVQPNGTLLNNLARRNPHRILNVTSTDHDRVNHWHLVIVVAPGAPSSAPAAIQSRADKVLRAFSGSPSRSPTPARYSSAHDERPGGHACGKTLGALLMHGKHSDECIQRATDLTRGRRS